MPAQRRRGLTSHGAARFAIVIPIDDDPHRKLAQRLGLGIAHTIFDAAGGSFRVERKRDGMNVEVRLAQARTR